VLALPRARCPVSPEGGVSIFGRDDPVSRRLYGRPFLRPWQSLAAIEPVCRSWLDRKDLVLLTGGWTTRRCPSAAEPALHQAW